MCKKWIKIGISGCTNGGKTTLSKFLQNYFSGCIVVNQDEFFRPDDSKEHTVIPELNHKNWDCLTAINWHALMEKVTRILNSEPTVDNALLIVEGHLIFNYLPLENIFHKKYFLKLNKEECTKRRNTRVYDPPDVPGYFEMCVWPMYLSNLQELEKKHTEIMFLDGADNPECISETVISDLKKYLSSM